MLINTCVGGQIAAMQREPQHDKTNKNDLCAQRTYQPGHLPILINAIAVRMKKP